MFLLCSASAVESKSDGGGYLHIRDRRFENDLRGGEHEANASLASSFCRRAVRGLPPLRTLMSSALAQSAAIVLWELAFLLKLVNLEEGVVQACRQYPHMVFENSLVAPKPIYQLSR